MPPSATHAARPSAAPVSVAGRTLHDQRRALFGWGAGLVGLVAMLLAFFPALRGNESIAKLLEAYPEAFRSMFAISDFTSGPGYLRSEVFAFTAPALLVVLAVLWGSDVLAGEEQRGTLDLLLANPISRRRVVVEKWLAMCAGVAMVTAVFGVALGVGDAALGMGVGAGRLAAAVVAAGLLAIALGTLAFAVAAASGRRALARGVTAAVAVASYLVSSLSGLVGWLGPLRPFSVWYHALGVDPIGHGFAVWHLGVLVAPALVLVALAAAAFDRRDLAVA